MATQVLVWQISHFSGVTYAGLSSSWAGIAALEALHPAEIVFEQSCTKMSRNRTEHDSETRTTHARCMPCAHNCSSKCCVSLWIQSTCCHEPVTHLLTWPKPALFHQLLTGLAASLAEEIQNLSLSGIIQLGLPVFVIMGVPAHRPSGKLTTPGGYAQAFAVFVWFGLFICLGFFFFCFCLPYCCWFYFFVSLLLFIFKLFLYIAILWYLYSMNKSSLLLHRRWQFCFTTGDWICY